MNNRFQKWETLVYLPAISFPYQYGVHVHLNFCYLLSVEDSNFMKKVEVKA